MAQGGNQGFAFTFDLVCYNLSEKLPSSSEGFRSANQLRQCHLDLIHSPSLLLGLDGEVSQS